MENEYLTPKCSNYKCYNETGINLKRKLNNTLLRRINSIKGRNIKIEIKLNKIYC